MLVVFLPALLYESAAFGIDMGIFLKQLPQILILAFPAMVTASGLTAIMLYAMAPASWTFWICWLIGVIASATDPVAVVALLKELGASKALGTLIEGESLLNDGSAVVLFVWVRNAIGYDYATLAPEWMRGEDGARYSGQIGFELLRIIAQMLILGCLLGWVFGAATKFCLKFVYNDRFIEASFIIGMSYFVFWLGELVMGSSAVLAVVVMGLYMNYNKSVISPGVLHFLHEFYEMVAHVLNTVIFLIAGCKLGALISDSSFHELFAVGTNTRTMIFMMYPIILVARGLAIALYYPLVSRLGTKCTWKDAVVMWWGGLRGSVGLSLGLTVHHMMYDRNMWGVGFTPAPELGSNDGMPAQDSLDCRDQPMMVLWLTIVVVVTTVIIQGITMAPLMRLLNMTKPPDERNFMLQSAYRKLDARTIKYIAELKARDELSVVEWDSVENHIVQKQLNFHIKDPDKAAWLLVLNLERAYYHAQFEDGVLSSDAFAILESFMANLAARAALVKASELGELYDKSFYTTLIDKVLKGTSTKASVAYEVGLAYLASQHEVKHLLGDVGDDDEEGSVRGGGRGGADNELRASVREMHDKQNRRSSLHGLALVASEHVDNVEVMADAMRGVAVRKPDAVRHLQTNHAKRLVLNRQEKLIKHMQHEGELLDLDALPLLEQIDHQLALLYTEPLKESLRKVEHSMSNVSRRAIDRVTHAHTDPDSVHNHGRETRLFGGSPPKQRGSAGSGQKANGATKSYDGTSPSAKTALFSEESVPPQPALADRASAAHGEAEMPAEPPPPPRGARGLSEHDDEPLELPSRVQECNVPPSTRSYRVASTRTFTNHGILQA